MYADLNQKIITALFFFLMNVNSYNIENKKVLQVKLHALHVPIGLGGNVLNFLEYNVTPVEEMWPCIYFL